MEKYVENYFAKLNEFEKNKGKFAALRDKEASFISMLSQSFVSVLAKTEPYIYFIDKTTEETGRSQKEILQDHENNRKQILEFYSKNCDNADDLYSTLQKQYNELANESIPLLKYGNFENGISFVEYLSRLVSTVEGKSYGFKAVLFDAYDGYNANADLIATDNISPGERFSSLDELRKRCVDEGALLLEVGRPAGRKNYSVFKMDKSGRFLEQNLFVPEKLSYVQDAISSLINLRIEKKDEHVSDENLAIFEDGFFSSMIDQMEKNYATVDSSLDDEISLKEESTKLYIDGIKQKKKTNSEQLASFMAKYKPKTEE